MTGEYREKRKGKGQAAENRVTKGRFNDAQFIQHELDKAQVQTCKAWYMAEGDAFEAILRMADSGYVVTLKYDSFSEAYSCFLRQSSSEGKNWGYILSGRGSTPFKALKQALFKHFIVMGEDWESFAGFDKRAEIDD